jgi:hypothetical protein
MSTDMNSVVVVDRNDQTRLSRTPWGERSNVRMASAETHRDARDPR